MSKVGMVAWIRDKGNPRALDPAWDRVCHLPRARAPVGRGGAWLRGFVLAVIREPWFRLGVMTFVTRGLVSP